MATLLRSRRSRLAAAAVAGAALLSAAGVGIAGADSAKAPVASFPLFANAKFANCLARTGQTPTVSATVSRGRENDELRLQLRGFKPGLKFDLFTTENSPQLANGQANPAFNDNFGMAWYQSDIEVNGGGNGDVRIKTILLDQIFGFDKGAGLAPTNTFHVGFWFSSPADAQPCGFSGSTPFNGDHQAGPLAFVTRPDATTNLGPLCTSPTSTSSGFRCNP